jgi:hypothetical protein
MNKLRCSNFPITSSALSCRECKWCITIDSSNYNYIVSSLPPCFYIWWEDFFYCLLVIESSSGGSSCQTQAADTWRERVLSTTVGCSLHTTVGSHRNVTLKKMPVEQEHFDLTQVHADCWCWWSLEETRSC